MNRVHCVALQTKANECWLAHRQGLIDQMVSAPEITEIPAISLAWQMYRLPKAEPKLARFNPRPAGVIRAGSASDAVLKYLQENGGFRTECQMLWATKRSHSAISWACLYLIRQGLIEARPDTARNSRYLKYRAKREVCNEK
jgi:hypothetical protein